MYNSYGRKGNFHLLLDYGFAIPKNEWDYFDIDILQDFVDIDPISCERIEMMQRKSPLRTMMMRHGYIAKRRIRLSRYETLNFELLTMERILSMNEDEINHIVTSKVSPGLPVDIKSELLVISKLVEKLQDYLRNTFPTSIAFDEQLLEDVQRSTSETNHMVAAIVYRISIKCLIKENIQALHQLKTILGSIGNNNQQYCESIFDKTQFSVRGWKKCTAYYHQLCALSNTAKKSIYNLESNSSSLS